MIRVVDLRWGKADRVSRAAHIAIGLGLIAAGVYALTRALSIVGHGDQPLLAPGSRDWVAGHRGLTIVVLGAAALAITLLGGLWLRSILASLGRISGPIGLSADQPAGALQAGGSGATDVTSASGWWRASLQPSAVEAAVAERVGGVNGVRTVRARLGNDHDRFVLVLQVHADGPVSLADVREAALGGELADIWPVTCGARVPLLEIDAVLDHRKVPQ